MLNIEYHRVRQGATLTRPTGAIVSLLHSQERTRGNSVDTPRARFHNLKGKERALKERRKSVEHALEEAVSRALRDNLAPLQRTADELQQAYADLVAACSSTRPSNALPAMLRAQTAASALAAGLSVLSNFVTVALHPREQEAAEQAAASTATEEVEGKPPVGEEAPREGEDFFAPSASAADAALGEDVPVIEMPEEVTVEEVATQEAPTFDLASLPPDVQDMHRRANRVAKVAMQDIQLLRPKDAALGRQHKDVCQRLRVDLDKARKEYDRRFRAILDHPVDYFHHWMVEILGGGDGSALGEYPYPSPVLHP